MSDKDKDKEEDERDVGECEHQDPPEQPGAGLAAVQAFRISASSLLWTCPYHFSRLRALSPPETCFHMMYRMAAHMRLYSMVLGNSKGGMLSVTCIDVKK